MKILVIDPYLTPSHEVWLNLLTKAYPADFKRLTLPPYHWKWRMHGGSMILAEQFRNAALEPDVILATEMLDLNVFLAHTRIPIQKNCPVVLYFHENQLTYPTSHLDQDEQKNFDNHYAFINFSSAVAADWVVFNSEFHQSAFLSALPNFIGQFPDQNLISNIEVIRKKCSVIYPGFDYVTIMEERINIQNEVPVILWNHRWEYDKDPQTFFSILERLAEGGLNFKLVVLGQSFRRIPQSFTQAKRSLLKKRLLHWGYEENRKDYYRWLWRSDIVVSTSHQDFFGISVVEAMQAECYPLLPDRLAFPEHIPESHKKQFLYDSPEDLYHKLHALISRWKNRPNLNPLLSHLEKYHPHQLLSQYENLFRKLT